jgi:hypothetical protein
MAPSIASIGTTDPASPELGHYEDGTKEYINNYLDSIQPELLKYCTDARKDLISDMFDTLEEAEKKPKEGVPIIPRIMPLIDKDNNYSGFALARQISFNNLREIKNKGSRLDFVTINSLDEIRYNDLKPVIYVIENTGEPNTFIQLIKIEAKDILPNSNEIGDNSRQQIMEEIIEEAYLRKEMQEFEDIIIEVTKTEIIDNTIKVPIVAAYNDANDKPTKEQLESSIMKAAEAILTEKIKIYSPYLSYSHILDIIPTENPDEINLRVAFKDPMMKFSRAVKKASLEKTEDGEIIFPITINLPKTDDDWGVDMISMQECFTVVKETLERSTVKV